MRPLSIVHTENSCGWGGQEIRILTEARGMQERGHRITLLAPPEAPISSAGQRMGLVVVLLPIRKSGAAWWRCAGGCETGEHRCAQHP
jgi:hypothetical protein